MADLLGELVAASHARADQADRAEIQARIADVPNPPPFPVDGFVVIAEIKPRSPIDGPLGEVRAEDYVRGGARAISVLTEPTQFGGSLEHLAAVRGVPTLRKDFVVNSIQVDEARAYGASAVLLIARIVERPLLAELVAQSLALGLLPVVEVFDEADLERAAHLDAAFAVNARDLATMGVDRDRFARLAPLLRELPDGLRIAASGVTGPSDVGPIVALGYRAVLVGTALMRSPDPAAAVAALVEAGCT